MLQGFLPERLPGGGGGDILIFAACSSGISLQAFYYTGEQLEGIPWMGIFLRWVSSNQDYTVLKMAFLEADSPFFPGGNFS